MAEAECTIKRMHLDAGPMKVALLVDNSYSARQSLNPLRAGLSAFLDALPPEHEVGLFTTGGRDPPARRFHDGPRRTEGTRHEPLR